MGSVGGRWLLKFGNRELVLHPGRWRIGRDPACEVRLDDERVSRHHATLRVELERVKLEDRGSRNGVRINGKRVTGIVELDSDDEIQIAEDRFVLRWDVPDEHIPLMNPTKPMKAPSEPEEDALLDRLSPREREVLDLLAQGYAQREIGEIIGVSVKTVETYRARLADKLGLRSRADIVRFALKAGVLRPE